jgi:hypothetical protein
VTRPRKSCSLKKLDNRNLVTPSVTGNRRHKDGLCDASPMSPHAIRHLQEDNLPIVVETVEEEDGYSEDEDDVDYDAEHDMEDSDEVELDGELNADEKKNKWLTMLIQLIIMY